MMNRTQSAAEQSKGTSSVRCRQILKQFGVVAALFAMVATVTVTTGVSSAGAAGTCVRAANDDGTVTLAWDADGDDKWVVREGTPGANEFATTVRNLPAFTGGSAERDYTIRYVEQGDIEVLCTAPVEPPPADGVCSVTLLDNGDVALTVVDNEAKTWAWRRGKDGAPTSYKGEVENFAVVDPAPAPGTYTYEVVSRFGAGVKETDSCGTITIEAEVGAQDCSVSLSEDGTVTVTWTDDGARNWSVRRGIDGGNALFVAVGENFTYTDTEPPAGEVTYVIRSKFSDDDKPETTCGTVTVDPDPGEEPIANVCSAVLQDDGSVIVTWDDNDARNWSVRRGIDGGNALFVAVGENFTYTDANPPQGSIEYVIRAKFADTRVEASCGTVEIGGEEPIVLECTLTDNGDLTVSVDWNDDGARTWSIRRGKNNGAPNFKGEVESPGWTSTVEADNSYTWQIVSRFADGTKVTTDCGSLEL